MYLLYYFCQMIDIFIPLPKKYSLQIQLDLYRFHFFMEGFKMNYRNLSYIFLVETREWYDDMYRIIKLKKWKEKNQDFNGWCSQNKRVTF